MLFEAITEASSLWVFLDSVLCFSSCKARTYGLRSGDWLGHVRILHFFALRNPWVDFVVCFRCCSTSTVKCRLSFAAFGWIRAENIALYTSQFNLLFLSAVTSQLKIRDLVQPGVIHARAIILPLQCLTVNVICSHEQFLSFSLLFPSFWHMLILVSSVQKKFQKCADSFKCSLSKFNLAFLLFSVSIELQPSVFTLMRASLGCWPRQWNASFTSSRMFLNWHDFIRQIFVNQGNTCISTHIYEEVMIAITIINY